MNYNCAGQVGKQNNTHSNESNLKLKWPNQKDYLWSTFIIDGTTFKIEEGR